MARFTDLPNEVINSICSYLHSDRFEPSATRIGLYGLLFASTRWNRIATPHFYHSLCPENIAAGLLALTLLRRPTLAALIRVIDLEAFWPIRSDVDRTARTAFLEEVGDLITIPDEQVTEREDEDPLCTDEQREDRRFHRRFTDFVLTRLPQLKVLALTLSKELVDPATIHAIRNRSQYILLNVEELEIRHWDTESGFKMSDIMPFLAGNTIFKVNLFACAGFGDASQVCPSVRNLQMKRTALEPNEFERLVRCFPNLEVLALETADSTVTEYMDDTPSTFQIGIDLRPLKGTLLSLTIDQRERFELSEDSDSDSAKPIGSLKVFDKLKELVIWQFDLTSSQGDGEVATPDNVGGEEQEDDHADNDDDDDDDDAAEKEEEEENGLHVDEIRNDEDDQLMPWTHKLPRSLQTLKIVGATQEIERGLWQLSEVVGEDYPNIRKVSSCRRVKGLKAAFQKAGVMYTIS